MNIYIQDYCSCVFADDKINILIGNEDMERCSQLEIPKEDIKRMICDAIISKSCTIFFSKNLKDRDNIMEDICLWMNNVGIMRRR